jgi:hypothetical protein
VSDWVSRYDWLRQLRDGIRVDPEIPPGVVMLESGTEKIARTVSRQDPLPAGATDEDVAEDLRSLHESVPYIIRISERGEPIRCECCGTLVALTPEAATAATPPWSPKSWTPTIWEPETGRRHTLRRCEWKRANP